MKTQEKITQVSIKGMHCNSCVSKVENALKPLADEVSVSLRPPVASLKNTNASLAQVNKALSVIGDYQAAALVNDSPSKSQSGDVSQQTQTKSWLATYQPLFLIITYILVTTLAINLSQDHFDAERWMMHFMAGFFLVFSFFKLLNIRASPTVTRCMTYSPCAAKPMDLSIHLSS